MSERRVALVGRRAGMSWLSEFSKGLLGAGEFPAHERAVWWARGYDILRRPVATIPLHNRCLPSRGDLFRLWRLSSGVTPGVKSLNFGGLRIFWEERALT